jgi:hypothetical protein
MNPEILNDLREYRNGNRPYPFGSFVTALLANDLVGAFMQADDSNRRAMHDYASFLYNEMPGRTGDPTHDYWGSYQAVQNRIAAQRTAHEAKVAS